MQLCNAVFEGGGVRGIGHIGAVEEFERRGYIINRVAGSSAGAIVASLLAAGYTGAEIKSELENLDYTKFLDCKTALLCPLEKTVRLFFKLGLHSGEYFYNWLRALLERKNVKTFGDIMPLNTNGYTADSKIVVGSTAKNVGKENSINQSKIDDNNECRLQIVASDISAERILVFPKDAELFGIAPMNFSVVEAVRMSMSIPFYYVPVVKTDKFGLKHQIVDGGVLSNYPIWLIDDGSANPTIPTFGFRFVSKHDIIAKKETKEVGLLDYARNIVDTMMNSFDNTHLSESKGERQRTVLISCDIQVEHGEKSIKSTDFDISSEESAELYKNGKTAAAKLLNSWNFEEWKEKFR